MNFLTTALIIFTVSIVIRFLFSSAAKKTAIQGDGSIVLKYPGFMAGVGYFAMAFGIMIAAVTVTQIIKTTGNEVVPYLVGFFFLLGLPLVLLEMRTRVNVSEQSIHYRGLIKKPVEIRWDEIQKVTFSFTSELVMHSASAKIKLNTILTGMESFVEIMKRKLKPDMYEKALADYDKVINNMQKRGYK